MTKPKGLGQKRLVAVINYEKAMQRLYPDRPRFVKWAVRHYATSMGMTREWRAYKEQKGAEQ